LGNVLLKAALQRPKRGAGVGETKRGKVFKIMAIADSNGPSVALSKHEASTHEVKLVEKKISKSL